MKTLKRVVVYTCLTLDEVGGSFFCEQFMAITLYNLKHDFDLVDMYFDILEPGEVSDLSLMNKIIEKKKRKHSFDAVIAYSRALEGIDPLKLNEVSMRMKDVGLETIVVDELDLSD